MQPPPEAESDIPADLAEQVDSALPKLTGHRVVRGPVQGWRFCIEKVNCPLGSSLDMKVQLTPSLTAGFSQRPLSVIYPLWFLK